MKKSSEDMYYPYNHPLYINVKGGENFIDSHDNFVRRKQMKSGDTILLGGRHYGKVVYKRFSQDNYEAYMKALAHDIPTEPLVYNKKGKPRMIAYADGSYVLGIGVLEGYTLFEASCAKEIDFDIKNDLYLQKKKILQDLDALGIKYDGKLPFGGHAHPRNFVAVPYKNGSEVVYKLHIIDRDHARLMTKKEKVERVVKEQLTAGEGNKRSMD